MALHSPDGPIIIRCQHQGPNIELVSPHHVLIMLLYQLSEGQQRLNSNNKKVTITIIVIIIVMR